MLFVSSLHGIDVNDVWFQQEAAACNISHDTMDLLHQIFDGGLISRNADMIFSEAPLKISIIYYKPETIKHLKVYIRDAIADPFTPYTRKSKRKLVPSNEILGSQLRQPYE